MIFLSGLIIFWGGLISGSGGGITVFLVLGEHWDRACTVCFLEVPRCHFGVFLGVAKADSKKRSGEVSPNAGGGRQEIA